MHRRVDGEAEAEFARPARDVALLGQAALVAGDAVGVLGIDVLDRELDVIEADVRPAAPASSRVSSTPAVMRLV